MISTTHIKTVLRNDKIHKYIFMFHEIYLARQELVISFLVGGIRQWGMPFTIPTPLGTYIDMYIYICTSSSLPPVITCFVLMWCLPGAYFIKPLSKPWMAQFYDAYTSLGQDGDNGYTRGPFYWHGLTLIPAWISNCIHYKMLDEINYPLLNFNGATVEV